MIFRENQLTRATNISRSRNKCLCYDMLKGAWYPVSYIWPNKVHVGLLSQKQLSVRSHVHMPLKGDGEKI